MENVSSTTDSAVEKLRTRAGQLRAVATGLMDAHYLVNPESGQTSFTFYSNLGEDVEVVEARKRAYMEAFAQTHNGQLPIYGGTMDRQEALSQAEHIERTIGEPFIY